MNIEHPTSNTEHRSTGLSVAALIGLLAVVGASGGTAAPQSNQWLGGPSRSLTVAPSNFPPATVSFEIREVWRKPAQGSFSGLSIHGDHATTLTSVEGYDAVVLLDAHTGEARWQYRLGRTRKRAEGVPLGPLSTPAIDEHAVYAQALDGRFVALSVKSGELLWEANLKRQFRAYEPGYGFASSPLLLGNKIVIMPAGSSSASVVALDCQTGEALWQTRLDSGAEYASATWLPGGAEGQIVAMLSGKLAGVSPKDGAVLWRREEEAGGLWTPSLVGAGRVFIPSAERSRLLALDPGSPTLARDVWESDVFAGAMGPVVASNGLLVGHHKRHLTGLDAATGSELWRQPDETDGQLLGWGGLLLFVHDRMGELQVLRVARSGPELLQRAKVMKPVRMETPLSFGHDRVYIRSPEEIIALHIAPAAAAQTPTPTKAIAE